MNTKCLSHTLLGGVLTVAAGQAAAAITACTLTPHFTVVAEGQAIDLTASCNGDVGSFQWLLNDEPLGGVVAPSPVVPATAAIKFTTPALLAGTWPFTFKAWESTDGSGKAYSAAAKVKIEASNALGVVTAADGASKTKYGVVDGVCGTKHQLSVSAMPSGTQQCTSGTPSLTLTTPEGFNWTCASTTGGADASCYAIKGYTVTASVDLTNGGLPGAITPPSTPVATNGQVTLTADPSPNSYAVVFDGTCGGTQNGYDFTTKAVTQDCTVKAKFSNTPVAGACGTATTSGPVSSKPTTNLCSAGTASAVSDLTSGQYNWTCDGINGSTSHASCSVKHGYTVTATDNGDANGNVTAPAGLVASGSPATIDITSATGYVPTVETASNCPTGALSGSGTSWTYTTGAITGACGVTVSFAPAPTGISCNGVSMPGTVVEVQTGLTAERLARAVHSPTNGDVVYAFKMTVPQTTEKSVRSLSATKTTTTAAGKRVVISECQGDYDPGTKPAGCYGLGTEVTTVKYSINYDASVAPTTKYCHLTPGKTYWVNVSARASAETKTPSCSTSSNCKFYFESN